MKIRLVVAIVGLAIGFVLPSFAQQTNTPAPNLRQQLLALAKKFDDAYDNNDPAALAALYTEDAVIVRNDGEPIYGREAARLLYASALTPKKEKPLRHSTIEKGRRKQG